MLTRLATILFLLLATLSVSAHAQTTVTFSPSKTEYPNPERGWWTYSGGKFQDFTDQRATAIAKDGYRIVFGLVRLDDYRNGPIPQSVLNSLNQSFAYARKRGLKVMVRFAYNFPLGDGDSVEDASLNTVLGHIRQIGPIITSNADTVVAMQSGFIGKWGEQHGSTNDLGTPENKKKIRDALYAAIPKSVNLVWRYPRDIMSWTGDTRAGFHNDCFLSSNTDVGTYSGDAKLRATERKAMAALTSRTFFAGETCSANLSEARMTCADILAEGAEFHLSSLNRNFYTGFHDKWKKDGCFDTVSRKMGYDLRLVDLRVGTRGGVKVTIKNDGWAKPIQPRPIIVTSYRRGEKRAEFKLVGSLSDLAAGATLDLKGRSTTPIRNADLICLSAPDTSSWLASNVAFSVRFSNADTETQYWDPKLGAFCFKIKTKL